MNKDTMTNGAERIVAAAEAQAENEKPFEEWSSAGIGNAFLFGKVMTSNPDLLLELLQHSLPEYHIQKIERPQREVDIKLSVDSHGVRLDILAIDDKGRFIDVEMQMRDEKNIPRRIRYYEGAIDQTILEKGENYSKLGELVILFITPFDPFGEAGFYRYTFRNTCQEDNSLVLNDGVTKVVISAAGHKGDISPELKVFLQMVAGKADSSRYAEGSFAERVQKQVNYARRNAIWRKEYMNWEMTLRNEREKGAEQERARTEEQCKRAEAAEERAKAEKERADVEKERAEVEKERADKAEEELRMLKEQIEKMQTSK